MKNYICLFFATLITHFIFGQTYTLKKPINEYDKATFLELSKELLKPIISFEYQFSVSDLEISTDSISIQEKYDQDYLKKTKESIAKDPGNTLFWNNLGAYYNSNNQPELAKESFQRALNLLDSADFSANPASYHSIKASLMQNLAIDGYLEEYERAFTINPNDTIASVLFPVVLLSEQMYEKAQKHCLDAFERFDENARVVWFIFLESALFMEQFQAIQTKIADSTISIEELQKSDALNLLDYSIADELAKKYPDDQRIKNCQLMIKLLSLFMKLSFSESEDLNITKAFTKNDKKLISEIKNELLKMESQSLMNEYSRIKNLAVTSLYLNELEVAADYFMQAIALFPTEKSQQYFNVSNSENGLITIWYIQKNYQKLVKYYMNKIENDTLSDPNISNYVNLAKCYYQLNEFDNAYKWTYDAFKLSPYNFEVNRLLAHHHFIRDNGSRIDFSIKNAMNSAETNDEAWLLYMQCAIYYIAFDKAPDSFEMIQNARNLERYDSCKLCDKIENEFIQVTR